MTTPQESPELDHGLGTITEERTEYAYDEGDHERFAHYVRKEKIVESAVTGTPVIALCGKVWVPNRDPKRFPVCPVCKEIYESIPKGEGDGDGGSGQGS
ncbi:DUF3039 domain-containing protein [Carbonactinospora thermoautotrophica]|uniref:DUF3039 domain-containing protein n=1 Tax=Carbonactinospora thermoautotrophica TaxID=1469144 RepID=A0A132NJK8_9ACTN|nr:DUF3039 domain-containing protein [Carbonactinospora thermoautotrophica]KWX02250.1 hypothetical protein LI90_3293 [Carbonactinospora thermoautotrophica]KWX03429.1 hypothetical protein TH66_10980 [Carbonactinospora thermoautotrophica]KWX10300.1 hypothetical protein TR74_04430 [Carbonactinospora thermoautotrophica]MCX9190142.1 DUF3039 domain-containing protein [Carbonactinospora thermoautotrophica]